MACNIGDKPKVRYKFANGAERVYESPYSPIDVKVETDSQTGFVGGQCAEWYSILFSDAFNPTVIQNKANQGIGVKGAIFSLKLHLLDRHGSGTDTFRYAWVALVGGYEGDDAELYRGSPSPGAGIYQIFLNYAVYGNAQIHGLVRYNPTGGVVSNDNCGDPLPTCKIIVSYRGTTIFTDKGKCPCTFDVQCEDCPEGTIKCPNIGYPGYCCLPCVPTANSIAAVKNQVQSINKEPVSYG
jgi:hypothetical protein